MRKARKLHIYAALSVALAVGVVGLPLVLENKYLVHILIITWMYTALGLGYDLTVGHVGLLSLAHPTFFGVGAYVAGIMSTRLGSPFLVDFIVAGTVAAGLALLVSVPFFRLDESSFAIGTLGFALIMQLVANNEAWLTRGVKCITDVPQPRLTIPFLFDWHVSSLPHYYYLMLGILVAVVALCWRLTTSRLGRTFISIREDEVLARASGVDPLKYKTFAFVIGALIAGSVGAFYVHYSTVVCPSELSTFMTTMLLIILFMGGVGRMRGVIMGGIVFTLVPELLRIAPEFRMVIYGVLLLVGIVFMPEGLDGILTRWLAKLRLRSTGASPGQDGQGQDNISN